MNTDTNNPNPEPVETPEVAPETPEPTEKQSPNREAAKYRRRLREAEAQATELATRLDAMQRREAERLASASLQVPADLWLAVSVKELLDADGEVDRVTVTEALAGLLEARPGLRKQPNPPSFDAGVRTSVPVPATMQDVLQGRRRSPRAK